LLLALPEFLTRDPFRKALAAKHPLVTPLALDSAVGTPARGDIVLLIPAWAFSAVRE